VKLVSDIKGSKEIRVFENRVVVTIIRPKGKEVRLGWREFLGENFNNL
jgi:hypothetical protein